MGGHPVSDIEGTSEPLGASFPRECEIRQARDGELDLSWPDAALFLSMSAAIVDRIAVGEGAHIAAGALVTKNVEAGRTVAGAPARAIRHPKSQPNP